MTAYFIIRWFLVLQLLVFLSGCLTVRGKDDSKPADPPATPKPANEPNTPPSAPPNQPPDNPIKNPPEPVPQASNPPAEPAPLPEDPTPFKLFINQEIAIDPDFLAQYTKGIIEHEGKKFYHVKFKVIEFAPNSILTTGGYNLILEAKEIMFSEGAKIRSLPELARASVGFHGADGGTIYLRALKAVGPIDFELRGQEGGAGFEGQKGAPGGEGARGMDGKILFSHFDHLKNPQFTCPIKPEKGRKGYSGFPGTAGGPGSDGGDAAKLILEIKDRQEFRPQFRVNEAGQGGAGGLGGPGGNPGTSGSDGRRQPMNEQTVDMLRTYTSYLHDGTCFFYEPDHDRPLPVQGPRGPQGASGKPGRTFDIVWL